MPNKLILEGNYDKNIHSLEHNCDAFGNEVELPKGFRFLTNKDRIKKDDWHFDIYSGWVQGHSGIYNGGYVRCEGRWRRWARLLKKY